MARLERVAEGMRLQLDVQEVDVLTSLAEGLAARLDDDTDPAHDDELMRRLAPEVSRSDPELDRELRAMLREDLLGARVLRLRDLVRLLHDGSPSGAQSFDRVLDRDRSMHVVEGLNDLRIALAATIGYESFDREVLDPDDRRADAIRLMDALAWLQGGLIEFIDGTTD